MNTMEKPTKTIEQLMNWQILAPKFSNVEVFALTCSKESGHSASDWNQKNELHPTEMIDLDQ